MSFIISFKCFIQSFSTHSFLIYSTLFNGWPYVWLACGLIEGAPVLPEEGFLLSWCAALFLQVLRISAPRFKDGQSIDESLQLVAY